MHTVEYLDLAKSVKGYASDYALAAALGVTRQSVSGWRSGRSAPEPLVAVRIANLIGTDPIQVIGDIEIEKAEKAHRPTAVTGWLEVLGRASSPVAEKVKEYAGKAAGTAITGFLVGSILLTPDPVNASSISPVKTEKTSGSDSVYYVNKRRRNRERRRSGAMAAITRTLYGFSAHH